MNTSPDCAPNTTPATREAGDTRPTRAAPFVVGAGKLDAAAIAARVAFVEPEKPVVDIEVLTPQEQAREAYIAAYEDGDDAAKQKAIAAAREDYRAQAVARYQTEQERRLELKKAKARQIRADALKNRAKKKRIAKHGH